MSDDPKIANRESSNAAPSADYTVGYGRPPKASQWKKGVSGNPRGRPKRLGRAWSQRQYYFDFLTEANALVPVTVNGKRRMEPFISVVLRQQLADAARGKFHAVKEVLKLMIEAHRYRARCAPTLFRRLDEMEILVAEDGDPYWSESNLDFLELARKQSRRF